MCPKGTINCQNSRVQKDSIADSKVGRPVNTADVPGGGCLLIQAAIIDMD